MKRDMIIMVAVIGYITVFWKLLPTQVAKLVIKSEKIPQLKIIFLKKLKNFFEKRLSYLWYYSILWKVPIEICKTSVVDSLDTRVC